MDNTTDPPTKRPIPTMLRRNSIDAEIRWVFRANGYAFGADGPPAVYFVDILPGGNTDAVAATYMHGLSANGGTVYLHPKDFNRGAIYILRDKYAAMDPYDRRLTVAHEAVHLIPGSDRDSLEGHGPAFRKMLGRAGYEELDGEGHTPAELAEIERLAIDWSQQDVCE
jgi:hypothetical protein